MKNRVILMAVLAWFVPAFASAQSLAPGEFRQLRSDDPECREGFTCFQVGPYERGADIGFDRMLEVVNRGAAPDAQVTILQLEAANPCGVMYMAPGRSPAVNGVCGRNGTTERVTFAEYCDGVRGCARWPFAGRTYRVPSVRILTPDERAEEMAREIANAVVTETVPAPATLGANLRELIVLRQSPQPPSDEHEVAALTAMADALDRTSAVVVPALPPVDDVPESLPVSVADHSAERIAGLEIELAAAQESLTNRSRVLWGVIAGAGLLMVLLLWSLATRKKGVIDMSEAQRNELRLQLTQQWERKMQDLERERDDHKSWYRSVHLIFVEATKAKVELKEFPAALKRWLEDAVVAKSKGIEPDPCAEIWRGVNEGQIKTEVGLARLMKRTGALADASAKKALEILLGTTHAHLQMQAAWAWSFAESEPFTEEGIKAIQARDHDRHESITRERAGFDEERKALTSRITELREQADQHSECRMALEADVAELKVELEKLQSRDSGGQLLAWLDDELRRRIHLLVFGEFGTVLSRVEAGRREVDAEKVKKAFSSTRTFARGKRAEKVEIHELKGLALTHFFRNIHEQLQLLLDEVDAKLGRLSDRPPPESLPSLLDHPDESETKEIPSEVTRFASNPLLVLADEGKGSLPPESTHPYASVPGVAPKPPSRDDETTKVVRLEDQARGERRDTIRGVAAVTPTDET